MMDALTVLKEENEKVKDNLKVSYDDNNNLRRDLKSLWELIMTLHGEIKALREEKMARKDDHVNKEVCKAYRQDIIRMKQEMEQMGAGRYAEINAKLNALKRGLQKTQTAQKHVTRDLSVLSEGLASAKSTVGEKEVEIKEKDSEIKEKDSEIEDLKDKLEDKQELADFLSKSENNKMTEIDKLKGMIRKLQNENEGLKVGGQNRRRSN